MKTKHKAVLLQETIQSLGVEPGMTVIDVTLGGGGHASRVLMEMDYTGVFIGFDVDEEAIVRFIERLKEDFEIDVEKKEDIRTVTIKEKLKELKIYLINQNFDNLITVLSKLKITKVDAIYADLGISTDQLFDENLGISFLREGELDMRMDKSLKVKAKDLINGLYQKELINLFSNLSDIKFAKRLANEILDQRKIAPIETTEQLRGIVKKIVPKRFRIGSNKHPDAKVFQALRIAVNHELDSLRGFLPKALQVLSTGGKLAIISFHSGEDKIVKKFFIEEKNKQNLSILFKLIKPSAQEIEKNNQSRSAKLRVIEKL